MGQQHGAVQRGLGRQPGFYLAGCICVHVLHCRTRLAHPVQQRLVLRALPGGAEKQQSARAGFKVQLVARSNRLRAFTAVAGQALQGRQWRVAAAPAPQPGQFVQPSPLGQTNAGVRVPRALRCGARFARDGARGGQVGR